MTDENDKKQMTQMTGTQMTGQACAIVLLQSRDDFRSNEEIFQLMLYTHYYLTLFNL